MSRLPEKTDKLTIRQAVASDLPAILAIYNYYVARTTATFDTAEQTLEQRAAWWEEHQRLNLPVLVALIDNSVIGWASLSSYHARPAYSHTAEPSLYISHGHQGKGVGHRLMKTLMAQAQEQSLHLLVVMVCSDNRASLKLLQEFDFSVVGTLREAGYKFDSWLDVTIAQKVLSDKLA